MASKPIDPRPVALPNLSQLPDPTKDLFGGMTSPTALMSMGEKEVNDLFSVKPLTDMYIKPSAEASKALQIAQNLQNDISRQATQMYEQQAREQAERAERLAKEAEARAKANYDYAERVRKEQENALKEKAKKQGGKVGAAPDGSFVLTADINKILGSQEWNSVVSDKQRGDQAEAYLSQYATQLKEMGVTDGQIAAEIENGRGIFKAHTDAYAKSMRSDGQGLLDLTVAPAAKAGAFIFNTAGVLSKLVSADTVGDFLLERGKTATDATNDFESASIKLDRANSAYDEQKFNKANPNTNWRDGGITGTAHGMGAAVKRAWDNDTLDNFVAEQIPQLIMTLGAGKVGATGVSAAGRAMGYTNLAANNVPTALRVLGGTYKTKSGVTQLGVNALSGASLGVGAYGTAASVGDAGAGAWEQVKSTSFDDIKKTYGEKKWADAVALHGGEEQARDALAGEALERAAGKVAPVGAVTSFLGVESTFAALLTRQAVKEEAKKLTLKGFVKGAGTTALSAVEEGVEEGYTQYASNVGATEFTGVDLMEGVSSAAGLGAFMGGATTAVTNIMSDAKKENDTLPNDFAKAFVEQGNFDDKAFRQNFERKMDWLSRGHKEGKVSTNDTQHFQQTYFNDYIDTAYTVTREDGSTDTKSIWDLMTPEQAQNFKDYVRLNYGINTNNYARHQDTVEYDTIKNNNMEVLSRPENADLLNVWRILNNTDTDQVPADKRDYYMALADTTIQLRPTETTHNTHEREQVFAQFRDTDLKNRGFDETQLTGITEFARTILGANSRRFTDEEQQAWNALQQEQSNGTNEQNQTGNSQSDGQGPIDGNAEPVATQGGGTGTSQATTLRQAAEELADAFSGRPASPDAQSVGNGNPRQGVDTSSQTNTPTENGAGVAPTNAGAGQAQTAGDTVNSQATGIHSGASEQAGNTEQANQGGQPTRPTVAPATQATTGGGSVGTPPTKRNTDGGGKQTPTQAANSLAETGADIPIEFVQQFINNNKPKKLTLAKVKGYVADKLGVPVTKTSPTQAQVLQYLAKIPNAQFIADLSAVFTNKGGKIVKDSQNTINDLHSQRHELYKAWAKSQPKTNPEQATTDTNADNGSQDVDETNVADIADENPQVAVEQPVQTADDVETVEQAEELVEDVIDFLLDTYPDLDVNEVLSSIYEHYDALNDYFINIPNANDQLADLFLMTSKIIEDKARYNRYTNALQNASAAAELVGDDFNMVFDNTIASADPAVTNNIEKRISRLEQYIELALDDAQNQQQENDRISAIREFNAEVERHNRELDEAIRNTGIEVPQFILQTSPADISNAIAELVTPLSKRGKSKRAKLASKKIKLPKSDKGNKQNLNQLVGDTRESVIITGAYDAPKTGHLVGTDTGVLFVPDDGTTAFELPTRPFQQDTINSWNKKNADTGISLDYTYHSFYDNEFYTRGDDFELNEVTAKQETASERAAQKALYDRQRQSRTDETSTSEQIASDNRREKVISQDENGRWRMQVANNRLPALRTIRLGTDVATDTGLGVIALDYKSDVQVSDAIQQLADATGLDFAQLTNLFVQELQNPVTFPYTQAQIDNLIARLDDEAENRAIPQTRVRRTPTVTETANANEQNQTETEPRESSPAIDTTATQDTAGASGLAGDTQTTASQAEPVKPKRGGRSKKKTTAHLDLFEQEQTNDTQNNLGQSVQPTRERTQDENQTDIVGNADTTNDEQGEILGQSGQPISKQSQESGTETTQDAKQLGVETAGDEVEADPPQPQAQTPTASEGNKAVDTNGKPVVVYRGASHGLGVMSFRGAMFFTDNKRVAESYVRGGKLHTATLYMANPAITDANGGEWGNVVPNGSKTQYVVDVLENDTLREENPELFELINNTIYESYEEAEKAAEEWERQGVQNFGVAMQGGLNSTAVSTDAFVRQAKAAGHDGVIIRNIIDGARTPSDIYVVFDTNQTTPIEDSPPTAPTDSQVRQTVSEQSQESGTETTQDTEQLGVETAGDEALADQPQPQAQTPTASEGNKAVDTNGKPVVVYRGASHGLGVMSFRGAMFFTDNKRVAESYVRGGKLHTATLYMANPAITDANGGEWGNVVPNGSKTQYVVDVLENDTLREENPELFELINNTIYESYEEAEKAAEEWERQGVQNFGVAMQGGLNSTAVSTDAFVRQAKAAGHDGVIIRNIIDGARTPSDIYVVFDTNQTTPIEDSPPTAPTDSQVRQTVSEQSQESGTETTQDTEQLGVETPKPKKKHTSKKDNAVAQEINEAVEKERLQKEFDLINDYHYSLPLSKQEDTIEDFIAKVGYALALEQSTAWQQAEADAQAKLKAEREARWTKLREREAQGIYEDDFDISENSSAIQSDIDAFTSERGILSGDRMGSQTGAVELEFLLALPIAVYRAAKAIWNAIKKNVAAVSMALAITTGTTLAIPTEANAATPTETAVVQNIVAQNDNQGKQFIVADKQAGTLTMYTASGQQITSTPTLFGKTKGDSVSSKNTPSGRFETKQANVSTEGYGGSAQVLTQNGQNLQLGGSTYAIHRVYTKYASENRQGRLDTPTATDNRISLGCINVPVDFYDTYLNSDQATVVYVMPETDAGRTGVFNVVPTATQTATDTKEQVEPAYDNANAQSVEVTPEQLTNATPHDQVKVAPKLVPTPLIVKGAEQSTQVAYTTPTVLGGANGTAPITADRIVTPKIDGKVVHTPAEQRADTSFDTEPVKDKTDDGVSLAEVAVGLAAAFAGGMYVNRRKERTKAKKLESKKRTPVADNPPPTDSTPTPDPTPNMPQDPPTTEQVQDTVNAEHNEQVNKSANNAKTIPTDIKIPPQPTATALAVNREMWLKYLVETNQLGETGSQEMADLLLNTLRGFEYSNLTIMTDKSYQQANDGTFGNHRWWGDGEVNTDRTGIFNKFINLAAGATPIFDNLMGKLGIARGGHEADSSLASIALAQVKSKAQGAYAQIHKFFVKPMVERTKLLAQELRRGDDEVELATGRVATANHILNEAADAMWRGFDAELAHLQDSLDKVNADLAANPSNKDYPLRTMNTAKKLEDEIRQVSELYTRTRNMYEGKTAWDGETKLPGGMTKARAEQDIAEVKAEYGADYAKIEENAKELTKSIRGIRQFATAAGVFTNSDIEVFNELGFDEYVPLYSEERDPTDVNEEDNYTQSSTMDRITQGIPLTQARSMGLTKDLSRYRRKGAKSPAADGFTNMKKFAMNMAGRVGQQNWVEMTQQLYEGTVGKPYSAANITDPDTLADLNASYDSGKVPGLIRVRPGMKNFLPSDIQTKIDKVRPIMGKGKNANGDTVAFEYYWTEPAIQVEIYANTDLSDTLTTDHLRNIGTATRAAARLVTVGKPMWNVYNFVRDSFERVSVMLMRPAKDQSGNLVPKWKLTTAFFRVLPTIVLNAKDIYRYLVLGEVKTPLQTMLNEAVGEGAINLMTTQTEKHSVIGDLKKSELEKAGNKISKWLGDTANKTGAGGVRNASTKGLDFYIVAITEIPQVSTALASYMAYQNVGVNKKESANRVRDAYDPNRTNNKLIHNIGQFHPFVRSTFSGHYNLARSLTQYWKPGEWQFTLAYTLGGTLGVIGLLSMLAGAFDDDDDGRSTLAHLPLSTLMGGVPVPWGENGVWTLPVGFGMNKLIWSIGANFYRYINGYQSADETAMGLAGLLVDNTSPLQAASGSSLAENPTAAAVMTATPMLLKPIVEMGFNTKAYGGGKIWGKDTPQDQLDSQQDNFNTPETYKKWAGWLTENGFGDFRPETLRHLFESYGNLAGPLSAIPQSVIADQSEKTLGNKERKGEVFGATLTALGAGMSIQPNALDVANLTYEMDARRYELHRKYGVGETHTDEIYEQYAQRGERGGIQEDAKYVTEVRLREKGVPEEHIKYIGNGMAYQKKREELDKEFKDLALEYNRLVASGKEDLQMRQSVQNAWDALETLTNDYVKENNNVFFTLQ